MGLTIWALGGEYELPEGASAITADATSLADQGRVAYAGYCAGCHGEHGDGRAEAGRYFIPPPCDFTNAAFRYSSRGKGELPTDDDLRRTIRHGLKRSAMPAFGLFDDHTVDALIAHLKSLSTRWGDPPADGITLLDDSPNTSPEAIADAVQRGRMIYHTRTRCWLCHPAYMPENELSLALAGANGEEILLRPRLDEAVAKPDGRGGVLYPPDFTRDLPRAGSTVADLHRSIAAGIGGSAMPVWAQAMPLADPDDPAGESDDLWSLAHYVHSLTSQRSALLGWNRLTVRDRQRPAIRSDGDNSSEDEEDSAVE